MKHLATLVLLAWWLAGIVVASGWWKLLAILFPPYALYELVRAIMLHMGFIGG